MSHSLNRKCDESAVQLLRQDLVKSDLQVKAIVQDIRECSGPADVLTALNTQVSDHMKTMKRAIEELDTLAREQDKEAKRQEMLREVDKYQKHHTSNLTALRKANLGCQALLDKHSREELLNRTGCVPRRRADKESLSKQSSTITDHLSSISQRMVSQVKQSEESLHMLINSSAVVTDTKEEFKSMGSVLHQSKTLLQKYGRREVTDKVLIVLAVIFFLSCVFYIVQKRLL